MDNWILSNVWYTWCVHMFKDMCVKQDYFHVQITESHNSCLCGTKVFTPHVVCMMHTFEQRCTHQVKLLSCEDNRTSQFLPFDTKFLKPYIAAEIIKPCISNFGENNFFFFHVLSLVSQILYWQNFACQFAKMSYLRNLETYITRTLALTEWDKRKCLTKDLYGECSPVSSSNTLIWTRVLHTELHYVQPGGIWAYYFCKDTTTCACNGWNIKQIMIWSWINIDQV